MNPLHRDRCVDNPIRRPDSSLESGFLHPRTIAGLNPIRYAQGQVLRNPAYRLAV